MNNNITEDYCSFEISKLLKEKGFAVRGNFGYTMNTKGEYSGNVSNVSYKYIETAGYLYKPTHSLAIKWLRINFQIDIDATCDYERIYWQYGIRRKGYPYLKDYSVKYSTPEEATEAALIHALNLI